MSALVDQLVAEAEFKDEEIESLRAENEALRAALDRYRGQIDRFGTHSAADALGEQR